MACSAATMERAILDADRPCTVFCITCFCGKEGFEAKPLVLFKARLKLKLQHMCQAGCLEKAIIMKKVLGKVAFRKVMCVKSVLRKSH